MIARVPADPTKHTGRGWRAALWPLARALLVAPTMHNAYRWRRAVHIAFGARLDPTARLRRSVRITAPWNLTMGRKSSLGDGVVIWASAPVTIGARSVLSQYVQVAAFRIDDANPARQSTPTPVTIGHDVWIAAESFVEGGAAVPDGVVVGARSVIASGANVELKPWTIASGDPAVTRRERVYNGPKLGAGAAVAGVPA